MVRRENANTWFGVLFKVLWLACALTARSEILPASEPERFFARFWQSDKGLPHNSVYAVRQAPDGYLWVATDGGLVRFDGYQFKPTPVDAALGKTHDLIRHLVNDGKGGLWLGTANGRLACYAQEELHWITPPDFSLGQTITSMAAGLDGSVWVGLQGLRMARVKEGVIHSIIAPTSVPLSGLTQLAVDRQTGRVWFAANRHWGYLQGENHVFRPPSQDTNAPVRLLAHNRGGIWCVADQHLYYIDPDLQQHDLGPLPEGARQINQIFEDTHGRFWCTTVRGELFYYHAGRWERVTSLPHTALHLAEDREGHLWIGTDGSGLVRLRPRYFSVLGTNGVGRRQPVRAVCEDSAGALWWTGSGRQLTRLVHNREYPMTPDKLGLFIRTIFPHPEEGVWLGTANGVYHTKHQGGTNWTSQRVIQGGAVSSLLVDSKQTLWVGTTTDLIQLQAGKIKRHREPLEGIGDAVQALAEDEQGRLWVGTRRGRLSYFSDNRFTRYGTSNGLSSHRIQAILPSADGVLWLGTIGGGLVRFRDNQAVRLTTAQGLPSDAVAQLTRGLNGEIWVGGSRGLFRLKESAMNECADGRLSQLNPVYFGRNDGLPSLNAADWVQPSVWPASDGNHYFATTAGLLAVQTRRLQAGEPAPVQIEELHGSGQTWKPAASLILPTGVRQIGIRFTSLGFAQADVINFRHRLHGVDENWVETQGLREARYTQLSPGAYRFEVQVCNNDGVWREPGAAMICVVPPFFWEAWWFIGLCMVVLAGAAALIYRDWSVRRLRHKLDLLRREQVVFKERERIARDIHDEIGAGLTNLSMLGDLALRSRRSGRELATELSRINAGARAMVRSLDEIVWAVNPRNDSLAALISYLCHYAQETLSTADIRCRLEVPENLSTLPLSAEFRHHVFLILKETLNNICKHSEATEVQVEINLQGQHLEIHVRDNGRGFEPGPLNSRRSGLTNLRARAALLDGTISMESRCGGPTTLRLTAPIAVERTHSHDRL